MGWCALPFPFPRGRGFSRSRPGRPAASMSPTASSRDDARRRRRHPTHRDRPSPGCGPGARPQRGSPGPSRPPRHDGSRRGPFETSPPFRPLACRLAHLPPVSLATLPAHGPSAGNRWSGAPTFGATGRSPAPPSRRARSAPSVAPSAPSRYGKRGQQVRRWLERRGRRAVRPQLVREAWSTVAGAPVAWTKGSAPRWWCRAPVSVTPVSLSSPAGDCYPRMGSLASPIYRETPRASCLRSRPCVKTQRAHHSLADRVQVLVLHPWRDEHSPAALERDST